MPWIDALPNLLIGLREGLEAGLVVTLLLAALRKAGQSGARAVLPIWLGVLGAVSVSGSFAAVITYSSSVLDSRAQQAIGGILSVGAVVLVTWMVFWMRRTARSLSNDLADRVAAAAAVGAGALAVTSFFAVGREGLETTLFIWTAVKASGATVAPLVGSGIGIAVAAALCALLYRGAVKVNLGVFFSRTAIVLIVIAAGILSYGLGDLQDAGLVPGHGWVAFDVTATVPTGSWWMTLVTGITDLTPRMTVLQFVAWVVYLTVVIPVFVRAGRVASPSQRRAEGPVAAAHSAAAAAPASSALTTAQTAPQGPSRLDRLLKAAEKRIGVVIGALVVLPAVIAGAVIVAIPAEASSNTAVAVSNTSCGAGWTSGTTGSQTFTVTNTTSKVGEIDLDDSSGAIAGEIETLGPATSASLAATLTPGTYTFHCLLSGRKESVGPVVTVTGAAVSSAPVTVTPPTVTELTPANQAYQRSAAAQLSALAAEVGAIRADLARGDRPAAEADWLTAQQSWERVGASYNSFGELGQAVDGLPDAYPAGVSDPGFTGLHRLEYGLWHGQSTTELGRVAATLATAVAAVQKNLTSTDLTGDPTNLSLRAHEILEDALRDHLAGVDDQGSGAAYALTYADTQVTLEILSDLKPLLATRSPQIVARADSEIETLQNALTATRTATGWATPAETPLAARQKIDAAIGAALETLSAVPDLLEVPIAH